LKRRSSEPRQFGCPPILWFDDAEKLHHFLGRSVETLCRWETRGLQVHAVRQGDRLYRYVVVEEFFSWLRTQDVASLEAGEMRRAS
jgi:hypothetical protein